MQHFPGSKLLNATSREIRKPPASQKTLVEIDIVEKVL